MSSKKVNVVPPKKPVINPINTVAAQSCLEHGFSREMVFQAINIYFQRHDDNKFSGKDLCEILLEMEDNPELMITSPIQPNEDENR